MSPPAPHANTTHKEIEGAAELPEHLRVVPSGSAADTLDRRKGCRWRSVDAEDMGIDEPIAEANAAPLLLGLAGDSSSSPSSCFVNDIPIRNRFRQKSTASCSVEKPIM
jgi:hypothetical protein